MNQFITAVTHPTCFFPPERKSMCMLHCGVPTIPCEKKQGLTVLDIIGVYFSVTACSLFRPFSQIFSSSLSLCPLSPLSLPALPERGWPLGLASLSLCHVCNLNWVGAKQGRATRKAFHKARPSLWSLSGSCSVRLHILVVSLSLLHNCISTLKKIPFISFYHLSAALHFSPLCCSSRFYFHCLCQIFSFHTLLYCAPVKHYPGSSHINTGSFFSLT